ncbi:MAG: MFS transporter [Pseudomonadota bacterium]
MSTIFLATTGGTFSSLGVLLPQMIQDIGWTWTQAGLGFTVLALFTGITSTVPAFTIERIGLRMSYLIGGILIASGFFVFSRSSNLATYLIGAAFIGFGYTQTGAVPAIKVLSNWFDKNRSFAIGLFFTAGAIGSIVGPLAASYYLTNLGSWRLYWSSIAVLCLGLSVLAALFISDGIGPSSNRGSSEIDENKNETDWEFGDVLRTPQYYAIMLGVTVTLLGALTMNTWQVTHMQNLGVATTLTASALSAHAFFNALSRAVGGLVIDRIGAKIIFSAGLFSGVVGMLALSIADSPLLILLFAIGDGISFGLVTFATSIILLDYYGAKNNPIILGVVNLVTTLAMVGPVLAGYLADRIGGFKEVFIGISVLLFISFAFILFVKPPTAPSLRKPTN